MMEIEQASARLEAMTEVEQAETMASLDPNAAEFIPQEPSHPQDEAIGPKPHSTQAVKSGPNSEPYSAVRFDLQQRPAVSPAVECSVNDPIAGLVRELANQFKVSRLPAPEPGVFHGNPLNYMAWKVAFETLI